ncbi:hypothetical protein GWK08_15985 [Leptobacterium flavescens]|uniref:Tetratricopeptide repeat protein n=1 Tax=Leptobacterium flavescens TaxID=472055 RepID=A0A6P0UPS3_9FLAO|nr:hypothetical protein [Leptobacterium flavescens]NER14957.1 hypothetical protein [Leptobacterium flavescens]
MNLLESMIPSLSDEEKKSFVLYLRQKNKRADTKNIALFRLLEKRKKDLSTELYTNGNGPAYHSLRKRLFENLIDFIAQQNFSRDKSEEMDIQKLILAANYLFEQKQYQVGVKTLDKAEKKAEKLELFSVLNDIYNLQIQFSHFYSDTPLKIITQKFRVNQKRVLNEQRLNMGYAILREELKKLQFEGKVVDLQQLIENTIEQLQISLKEVLTFKSLYQIMFITNEYAAISKEYHSIESFLRKSYDYIIEKESLTGKHLYYHIYILYFMANVFFRNRKFAESMEYTEKMEEQMQKNRYKYYNRFVPKHALLSSLNHCYSGKIDTAIQITSSVLETSYQHDMAEIFDLRLSLALYYFQKTDFRQVSGIFKGFYHTDNWYEKKVGIEWAIKKNLMELILHLELENIELCVSRMQSFKRRYLDYLKALKEKHLLNFVSVLDKTILFPSDLNPARIPDLNENEDIFTLSFYAWLKAKQNKKDPYDTVLAMVNKKPH